LPGLGGPTGINFLYFSLVSRQLATGKKMMLVGAPGARENVEYLDALK